MGLLRNQFGDVEFDSAELTRILTRLHNDEYEFDESLSEPKWVVIYKFVLLCFSPRIFIGEY